MNLKEESKRVEKIYLDTWPQNLHPISNQTTHDTSS